MLYITSIKTITNLYFRKLRPEIKKKDDHEKFEMVIMGNSELKGLT